MSFSCFITWDYNHEIRFTSADIVKLNKEHDLTKDVYARMHVPVYGWGQKKCSVKCEVVWMSGFRKSCKQHYCRPSNHPVTKGHCLRFKHMTSPRLETFRFLMYSIIQGNNWRGSDRVLPLVSLLAQTNQWDGAVAVWSFYEWVEAGNTSCLLICSTCSTQRWCSPITSSSHPIHGHQEIPQLHAAVTRSQVRRFVTAYSSWDPGWPSTIGTARTCCREPCCELLRHSVY